MHHRLDTDSLPIPRRTVVYHPPLPRHLELLIRITAAEEVVHVGDDLLLLALLEDHVVPAGLLDAVPELVAFLPEAAVEDPDFVVQLVVPGAGFEEELVGGGG